MRIPWWLNPWRAYLGENRTALLWMKDYQDEYAAGLKAHGDYQAQLSELGERNAELIRQVQAMAGAQPGSGRALLGYEQGGGSKTEAVLVLQDRGAAGGKRVYASNSIGGAAFETVHSPGVSFPVPKISASMDRMLTVDKPSYGEALARILEIWQNWLDGGAAAAIPPGRREIGK